MCLHTSVNLPVMSSIMGSPDCKRLILPGCVLLCSNTVHLEGGGAPHFPFWGSGSVMYFCHLFHWAPLPAVLLDRRVECFDCPFLVGEVDA